MGEGTIFRGFLTINPQTGVKHRGSASAAGVKVADFRCYLLDRNRKVIAIKTIRALALPRAVTKGILAAVARQAATFELRRNNLCVYTYEKPVASPATGHDAADH